MLLSKNVDGSISSREIDRFGGKEISGSDVNEVHAAVVVCTQGRLIADPKWQDLLENSIEM